MKYFPIFLDLEQRGVLVVGGGEKAAQKIRLLAKTPAHITVVGSEPGPEIAELAAGGKIRLNRRAFHASDVDGMALVIAADDHGAANAAAAAAAKSRAIPVNVVDGAADSTFIMPAIVDRAPVTIAIGTEGAAPVLARDLKSRIERWLPANFGRVAAEAGRLRARIAGEIAVPHLRRRVWERLLKGAYRSRILEGDFDGAARAVETELEAARDGMAAAGSVTLIGCGPGDPDLLTLKAQQRLQDADVLVIDRLVNPAILDYARRDALRFFVGKDPEGPSTDQDEINRILVREALKGHHVARLKGGDAFIFGRAAEEMAAVRAAGIEVEIIPGVTAAHACAARIGLPVTLRRKVRQFAVVTGAAAEAECDLDWAALARPGQAFAIYMGVRAAPRLSAELLAAGADPATAVVIVENGTLRNERAIAATLADLPAAIADKKIKGPAIIFVGLDWQEAQLSRPHHVEVFAGDGGARRADRQHERPWTAAEVALATFWVAG